MNIRLRFMVVTAAIVILPLYSAFSAQIVQEVQQDVSLEARISQLQQRVAERPRDPDLHFELSKLYEEDVERYYDEALSEFKVAVENGLSNNPYDLLNRLVIETNNTGTALWKVQKYDAAIVSFTSAIALDPNNPKSYSNMAITYSSKGDHKGAITYMNKAVDISPVYIPFYQTFGAIYLKKEDFELALLSLEKIGCIDSKYDEHYYGMARVYHGLGQYANAIDALDQLPRKLRKNETVKAFRKECVDLLRQNN